MRVAIVYPSLPPRRDGGADYVWQLTRALAARGVELTIVTDEVDARAAAMPWASLRGVSTFAIDRRSAVFATEARRLRDQMIDVVHVIFPSPRLTNSYWYPGISHLLGPAVVGTVWNLNLGSPAVTLRSKLNALRFMRRADVLTTHDPQYRAALVALRLPHLPDVHLVPVGYNLAATSTSESPPSGAPRRVTGAFDSPRIVYFGSIDPSRGLEDLIAALPRLRARHPALRLVVIAGGEEGPYRDAGGRAGEYYRTIRALGARLAPDAIDWTPHLAADEVEKVMQDADAVVLPYRRNSVGRSSVAAAFTLGCPTVIAAHSAFLGFLEHRANCLVVPRGSPDAIAGAVDELLRDPALARRLSAGARRTACERLSWTAIADQTLAAYEEALRRRRRRSPMAPTAAARRAVSIGGRER